MNIKIKIISVVMLISMISCADSMRILDKEEVISMYQSHSDHTIEEADDFCVEKASSFSGIYSIGWFANDLGCPGNEILVAGEFGTVDELTQKGLRINGWNDNEKREQICLDWTDEVLLCWETPLHSTNEDFEAESTPVFHPPECEAVKEGWKVLMWVEEPAGMLPQSNYYQLEVHYNPEGKITKQEIINSYTISYE
jgi:hypothetical protein